MENMPVTQEQGRRSLKIDLLRIISCCAVVMIHMVTAPVAGAKTEIAAGTLMACEKTHILLMWAVPLFFMISGYCCLGRNSCDYRYCFKHIRKYILVLATFGLAYCLLEEIYKVHTVNMDVITKSVLNVINGKSWAHMWFVYSIIGVYLVYPVLHAAFEKSKETACIITLLLFAFTFILPLANRSFHLNINVGFPFGNYLFYVCFGGVLRKYGTRRWHRLLLCVLGLGGMIFIIFEQAGMKYDYLSLPVCLMAMGIFSAVPETDYDGKKQSAVSAGSLFLRHISDSSAADQYSDQGVPCGSARRLSDIHNSVYRCDHFWSIVWTYLYYEKSTGTEKFGVTKCI